jgi:CubicO group peptidase (beta-lactamase class C family)
MGGITQSGAPSESASELGKVGRRGFIGAGLATAGAAVLAQRSGAATPRASSPRIDLSPPAVDPNTQSLVPIPEGRVASAVGALDEIIREVLSRTGVPGLAAAVVQGGELVYAKGFGVRDVKTGIPVNAQTVFHLASVSKSLSSTVVAGIVGRKQIQWADPIIEHLPNFALSDRYVTENVSYADMFSHTSGLPDFAGDLLEELEYPRRYILHALRLQKLNPHTRLQGFYVRVGWVPLARAATVYVSRRRVRLCFVSRWRLRRRGGG